MVVKANTPAVSVVMPVFNGSRWLAAAIESILVQSFTDFECIIVDDGSTDTPGEIIRSFRDDRIRLLENGQNIGLPGSLNRGIAMAVGKYVARMDSDDLSDPRRLARQVAFMEKNPRIGASGTWVETIGPARTEVWRAPENSALAKASLLFDTPLLHPTVMFRRELFAGNGLQYDASFRYAQDYDLWERASHYTLLGNVPEALVKYRIHEDQVGSRHRTEQVRYADHIRERQLRSLGLDLTEDESVLHRRVSMGLFEESAAFLIDADCWLRKIVEFNERAGVFDDLILKKLFGSKWLAICRYCWRLGPDSHRIYERSPLAKHVDARLRNRMTYLFRSHLLSRLLGKEG